MLLKIFYPRLMELMITIKKMIRKPAKRKTKIQQKKVQHLQ